MTIPNAVLSLVGYIDLRASIVNFFPEAFAGKRRIRMEFSWSGRSR